MHCGATNHNYEFKKEAHREQAAFNGKVQCAVQEACNALGEVVSHIQIQRTRAMLQEGMTLLAERQKLIRIADRSVNGWSVVAEYTVDELVEDSEGEKHLEKAEKAAERKARLKQQKKQLPKQMHELPRFYWLPKMHKSPCGCRFTVASGKCTTKPLSSILTSCSTTVITHLKEYCDGNTGVNAF